MARDERYNRLIQSTEWRRIRAVKLGQQPLCERCKESGRIELATEVHHKDPCEMATTDFELRQRMFEYSNLESLCHDCHVQRHIDLRSKSKKATKERNEKALGRFVERFM
jgi:5-methylcytosine-specific restriction protein A